MGAFGKHWRGGKKGMKCVPVEEVVKRKKKVARGGGIIGVE